jgi:hypothetical protein
MPHEELIRELTDLLYPIGFIAGKPADALRRAIALLTPATTSAIETARAWLCSHEWVGFSRDGKPVTVLLEQALDALAREQSRSMTDEDVLTSQCKSIRTLEARLVKIREVLGVEPEETEPLAEVARILQLCARDDAYRLQIQRVREALAACTCMCKHVHAAKAALANEVTP